MFGVLLLLAAQSIAHAGGCPRIDVPGDFPTVQEAIDAAQPGAKIVVHGGTFGPLLIDKPLSIIGDPAPLFGTGRPASIRSSPIRQARSPFS